MALAFNGATKEITITVVNTLDVKDLWSRWVDWFLTGDNSKYGLAMQQIGGNDIDTVAGTSIPIYIYLLNGWKIKPREANHTLAVTNGILLTDDSSDPFKNTTGAFVVRVNYQQPVQALTVATGGGSGTAPTAQEVADAVWDEVLAGHTVLGSSAELISRLIKHAENRWKIDNNQLTIYDDDGVTPLYVFDLKDASGNPTESSPFERVPTP